MVKKTVVIGAGLAGLTAAIMMARYQNREILLIEKKTFPFHRVCGEYLSLEVLPFLKREKLLPEGFEFPIINKFTFTGQDGKGFTIPSDLGGLGISRHLLDHHLWKTAGSLGVHLMQGLSVDKVLFEKDKFQLTLSSGQVLEADHVLGAFGKKSRLDVQMQRGHLASEQGYIGVKYHMLTDVADDVVELHNFPGGYCGVSRVEEGRTNLCYLSTRANLRGAGSLAALEENILMQNPRLAHYFQHGKHLWEQALVINDFGFQPKSVIENHMLMLGDAAGLITPLCGNGMAMAIRAGILAAKALDEGTSRMDVERIYLHGWNAEFKWRLRAGRGIQTLFGKSLVSSTAARLPALGQLLMPLTHGKPF
jgi:flavin-dependent dehydrogenase